MTKLQQAQQHAGELAARREAESIKSQAPLHQPLHQSLYYPTHQLQTVSCKLPCQLLPANYQPVTSQTQLKVLQDAHAATAASVEATLTPLQERKWRRGERVV